MEIPRTQRLANEFEERNVVLQLVLGGLGLGARLDAFLERWAPLEPSEGRPRPVDFGEAAVVELVLGVIAFREHFEAVARRYARREEVDEPSQAEAEAILPEELLR